MNAVVRNICEDDDKIFDIFRQPAIIDAGLGPGDMFFLRCIFWLGVVYASISWPVGTFSPPTSRLQDFGSRAIALGSTEAQSLAKSAGADVAALCDRHRAECFADAARLTALISAGDEPAEAGDATPVAHDMTGVPLPVPDPRRAGRGVKPRATP